MDIHTTRDATMCNYTMCNATTCNTSGEGAILLWAPLNALLSCQPSHTRQTKITYHCAELTAPRKGRITVPRVYQQPQGQLQMEDIAHGNHFNPNSAAELLPTNHKELSRLTDEESQRARFHPLCASIANTNDRMMQHRNCQ